MNKIISFAFLAIIVFYGFHRCSRMHPADYFDRTRERAPAAAPAETAAPAPARVQSESHGSYACEGKTRCRQMGSCEEARYYLEHCPGVEIDGDGDGIPCEDMCGH